MTYRWIIIDEDGTPRGTNNEECASTIGNSPCAMLVLDLESGRIMFEGASLGNMEEQTFDPLDWEVPSND